MAESTSYWGFITHDLSVVGTQEVRGIGFKPKAIIIIGIIPGGASYGIGLVGVNDQSTMAISSAIWHERWRAIHIDSGSGGSGSAYGQIVNLNNDGFDINWTIDGSPVGTGSIAFLALNF